MNVSFSKGELLQLISATYVDGKDEELREYFDETFPIAGRCALRLVVLPLA